MIDQVPGQLAQAEGRKKAEEPLAEAESMGMVPSREQHRIKEAHMDSDPRPEVLCMTLLQGMCKAHPGN